MATTTIPQYLHLLDEDLCASVKQLMSDRLKLELDSYDARFILETLQELSDKWRHINRITTDEDEQADYGNDVMFLDSRRERIERLCRRSVRSTGQEFFA